MIICIEISLLLHGYRTPAAADQEGEIWMNDQPHHKREECYYLNFNEFEAKLFGHPIVESIRFHNKDTQWDTSYLIDKYGNCKSFEWPTSQPDYLEYFAS